MPLDPLAGWRLWRARPGALGVPLLLWAVQLGLNAAWSWLFFGLQRPDLALIDILLLLVSIIAFIALARPVSHIAALLFVPYGAWVAFAAALNLVIWQLNR